MQVWCPKRQRSQAVPNSSVPFGNSLTLSGTIYLLNGDFNASALPTGALGRLSVHKTRSLKLGTCKCLVNGSHSDGEEEEDSRYLLQVSSIYLAFPTWLR